MHLEEGTPLLRQSMICPALLAASGWFVFFAILVYYLMATSTSTAFSFPHLNRHSASRYASSMPTSLCYKVDELNGDPFPMLGQSRSTMF
ncbi:hypothetical protein K402DRAFT_29726 [Aulographum hederae CBS 113979]|uniref:Uncharacterized protein n=1 Tax=Aulographum hederae CBS 113979 TaxID=1176131 RepID=A0A6G1H4J2_9PEZI|nr:hypothetical protein K402DRAFT_29726 [Aulographum hederae CBS 113979]